MGGAFQTALAAIPAIGGLIDRFRARNDPFFRSIQARLLQDQNFLTGFDPETGRFNQGNPLGDTLSGFGGQFGFDEEGNPFTAQQANLRFIIEQLNASENAQTRGINAFGDIGNRFGGPGASFATDFQNPQTEAVADEFVVPGIIQGNRPIPEPLEASRPGIQQRLEDLQEQSGGQGQRPLLDFFRQRLPITQEGESFQAGTPFVNPPLGQQSVNVQVDAGEAIIPAAQNSFVQPAGGTPNPFIQNTGGFAQAQVQPTGREAEDNLRIQAFIAQNPGAIEQAQQNQLQGGSGGAAKAGGGGGFQRQVQPGAKPVGGVQDGGQQQTGGLGFQDSGVVLNELQNQAFNPADPAGLNQLNQQAQNPQANVGLQGAQDVFGQGFNNVAGQENLNQLAQGGQGSVLGDILQNPTGFNQQTQTDIFNIGKNTLDAETAALQRQFAGAGAQSGALGTGTFGAQSRGLETSRLGQLADLQRRIGIDAAQTSFQNQLGAGRLQQEDLGRQFESQLGASEFDLNRLGQQGQGLVNTGLLEDQVNQGNFQNLFNTVGLGSDINQRNFQNLGSTVDRTERVIQGQFGRNLDIQDRISGLDVGNQQRRSDFIQQIRDADFTAQELEQLGLSNLSNAGSQLGGGAPA